MLSFYDFLDLVAGLLRMLGMLVFGVAAGWFTLYAFRQPERRWQLQIAVFLGFLLFAGITIRFSPGTSVGSFGIGAATGLLFWGLKKDTDPDNPEEEDSAEE